MSGSRVAILNNLLGKHCFALCMTDFQLFCLFLSNFDEMKQICIWDF